MLISIIILCILLILCVINIVQLRNDNKKIIHRNYKTEQINNEIEEQNKILFNYNKQLTIEKNNLEYRKTNLQELVDSYSQDLKNKIQENEEILEQTKQLSTNAFNNFWNVLEKDYEEKSSEYDAKVEELKKQYGLQQKQCEEDISKIKAELDKIKATRSAAIEANRREKEIENNLSDYCIQISEADKNDIKVLNNIKTQLNQPRVLSMLIWSTFFQKQLKTLSNNILGTAVVIGIYKITNIVTKECYIGQAVDVAKRWAEHTKCGLGIDTPTNNKLYKAMDEYGVYNFSFELLEQCPKEQLNEKERFYIDLYDSYNYGMNSNRGNK